MRRVAAAPLYPLAMADMLVADDIPEDYDYSHFEYINKVNSLYSFNSFSSF